MADIVTQFGINGPLLIAQIVNFALLAFVLQRFLYKPIVKYLDKRRDTIAQSLRRAKEVDEAYQRTTALRQEILAKARVEAEAIVKQAMAEARQKADAALKTAAAQQERALSDTRAIIETERADMVDKLRVDIADMVVAATEKLLAREFGPKDEERLVIEAAKALNESEA